MRRLLIVIVCALLTATIVAYSQDTATEAPVSQRIEFADSIATDSVHKHSDSIARPASTFKVSPVESDEDRPDQPQLHFFDKHGNPLKEPVLFLAELDTISSVKPGPVYPLLNSVSIGANFFDAIMKIAGQKHSSFDLWANLSLFNWFFPTIEAGIGFGKDAPELGNFTYTAKPSFYVKAGLDYNFFYKSNPDYQLFLGIRAGFSSFHYDITGITVDSEYWDETSHFDILGQHASAFYGEVLAGIKVKIYKNFALGWTIRYRNKFKVYTPANSNPWFIPGCGTASPLGVTLSAIYTIPLSKDKQPTPDTPTP